MAVRPRPPAGGWGGTTPGFWTKRATEYSASDMAAAAANQTPHDRCKGRNMEWLWRNCESCWVGKLRWMLRQPLASHERRHGERLADIIADMGIRPDKDRDGYFVVPSASHRGIYYTVRVIDGRGVCDCPGDQVSNEPCYHVRSVLEMVETMGAELVPIEQRENVMPVALTKPARLLPTNEDLQIIQAIANVAARTAGELVPRALNTPAKAMAVMLRGHEVGCPPMTSLEEVYLVEGRTYLSARLMMGIVIANDQTSWFEFTACGTEAATVVLHRVVAGKERLYPYTYTIADAKRSGSKFKSKTGEDMPWQRWPEWMLVAKAIRGCIKLGAFDVVGRIAGRTSDYELSVDVLDEPAEPLFIDAPDAAPRDRDEFAALTLTELERAGASKMQARAILGDASVRDWLFEHPTKSLRDLARDAAKVELPPKDEPKAETPVAPENVDIETGEFREEEAPAEPAGEAGDAQQTLV